MKQFKFFLSCLFVLFLSNSCSSDDDQAVLQENYLKASVGESSLQLNDANGNFVVTRVQNADGSILLSIAVSTSEEDGFFMQIPYYKGAGRYEIKHKNMATCIMSFQETNSHGKWVCKYPGADGFDNYIEISKDGGSFIEGSFEFSGRNTSDSSLIEVRDGKFGIYSAR
ncbi:hypothetical protein C7S20_00670 [Christiangramia fulva]|uniref:Lipoprotein n=1 Tax=Christiangramia fulva TaxID=2126553 RepID=A0A2R3Z0X3_9FLAO|nr:hypothetical protein [Christiangramia fulva]AVR43904.1 hypothetical protein C7S20_00670 [Christiangramia fulva]